MNPRQIEKLVKNTPADTLDSALEHGAHVQDHVYAAARTAGLSMDEATAEASREGDLAFHIHMNGGVKPVPRNQAVERSTVGFTIRYLYHCPRGFANETSIYRISTLAGLRAAQQIIDRHNADPDGRARFVPRSEAEAHCRANRRQAKSNLHAGLNLTENPVGACEIIEMDIIMEVPCD